MTGRPKVSRLVGVWMCGSIVDTQVAPVFAE